MPRLLPARLLAALLALAWTQALFADGYVGLTLRDLPEGRGVVVSRVLPGPLEGSGLTSSTLCRPDLIISMNGAPVPTAAAFEELVRAAQPGNTMVIEYRASRRRGGTIPDIIDHEDAVQSVTVTVAERDDWTGSIGRPPRAPAEGAVATRLALPPGAMLDPSDGKSPLGRAVAETNLAPEIARTRALFASVPKEAPDPNELTAVLAAFDNPFRLPEIAEALVTPARAVPSRPFSAAVELAAKALDLPMPEAPGGSRYEAKESQHGIFAMDFLLNEPRLMLDASFGARQRDEAFARQCLAFLAMPAESFTIGASNAREHLGVIQQALATDFAKVLAALNHLDAEIVIDPAIADGEREEIREELKGAVEGELLNSQHIDGVGWVVVGGPGPNRYDMAKVAAVVDVGGNDRYEASGLRIGNRGIIDLGGDDRYVGTPEQGPGSALLGLSFIDDRGGNDVYEGGMLSVGAAIHGAAIVVDRGGNDVYRGTGWSLGAAIYGIGILADLGDGADVYEAENFSQGVGGPRGLGAIIDSGGRDRYRLQDPAGSAYGTPAVDRGLGQGFGFGLRSYAAGGIGMLCDFGGDDRYDAGEFSQGGGYYHALGILWDVEGRDLYVGNRYGQGFGVHQAFGALVDGGGDDTYWSMTAASQGAGWDLGAGLLLDRAGNDSYQADGLAQGAAAQQAMGFLVDLAGDDRYAATGPAVQGTSGANEYQWGRTRTGSFSLIMDVSGRDWFSSGLGMGVTRTGPAPTESGAENGTGCWGLGIRGDAQPAQR